MELLLVLSCDVRGHHVLVKGRCNLVLTLRLSKIAPSQRADHDLYKELWHVYNKKGRFPGPTNWNWKRGVWFKDAGDDSHMFGE